MGSHFIPNLIKGYLKEKGKNHIHFSFGQERFEENREELKDGKYDLHFLLMWKGKTELEFIPVGQEELVLITPKDHPLAQKEEIDLLDTVEYDYVYFTKNSGLRPVIDSCFSRIKNDQRSHMKGKKTSVAGLLQQDLELRSFQRFGFLIQWMWCVRPIISPEIERYIYLVLKKKISTPVVKDFISFITDQMNLPKL